MRDFTMATESKERESNLAVSPFCQIEHVFSDSDSGTRCSNRAVTECAECGAAMCADCRLWCCGQSFRRLRWVQFQPVSKRQQGTSCITLAR